ncbi:MAG: methyl-accepting chemotaxis protein [Rhodospirillaceae bacterium]|nr:MAG: methyl-accepting chemotaxis protein [Rhodospirillaceae bacterium]
MREVDDRIDRQVDIVVRAYDQFSQSLSDESRLADEMFDKRGVLILWGSILAAAVATVAALGAAWAIASGITGPVKAMTDAMTHLAGGDKSVTIPATENKDEIGAMARAVQVFKNNAIELDRMTSADAEEQKKRAEMEKKKAMNDLANALEASVKGVVERVSRGAEAIVETAGQMGKKLDTSTSRTLDVAEASIRTAQNVDTVAAAAEELSASINEISRQVAQSAEITSSAADDAGRTNTEMKSLAESA